MPLFVTSFTIRIFYTFLVKVILPCAERYYMKNLKTTVHEACERIETNEYKYSCIALKDFDRYDCCAAGRYTVFYGFSPLNRVENEDGTDLTKKQRIIMLLLFLEAYKDVL